jgi:hypothetical protein
MKEKEGRWGGGGGGHARVSPHLSQVLLFKKVRGGETVILSNAKCAYGSEEFLDVFHLFEGHSALVDALDGLRLQLVHELAQHHATLREWQESERTKAVVSRGGREW